LTKPGWRLFALALAGLLVVGCSSSGNYPVSGKVVDQQGQPIAGLAGSEIYFSQPSTNTSSVGEIAADGSFTMYTQRPGDGVPPGDYQVYIPRRRIDPEREAPQSIEAKFEKPESSGLQVTVEKKKNTFEFKVNRVAGRNG
jgi:hypothetical protein